MVRERCPSQESFVPFGRDEIEQSIPDRFRQRAASTPDAIAVRTATVKLSYSDLDRWSDAIASQFIHLGSEPEPIPFLLGQGPLAIATTLAILKAGKYYVPLDPSWGIERAVELVKRLGARILATDAEFAAPLTKQLSKGLTRELSTECPREPVPSVHVDITPDRPAYVYFTSGSTGPPKGVMDCHRNVLHNVMRYTNALQVGANDRLTLLQSCGFSGAVSSMFVALLNGATSCPVDLRRHKSTQLARWLEELEITIYHSVPSLFRNIVSAGGVFPLVRVVRLEGDRATRLDVDLFRKHFAPPSVLAIGLGATETGLVSQYFVSHESAVPEGPIPIGYPAEDVEVEIREDDGKQAPTGTAGEIIVKSHFLATGYWKDELSTARAFEHTDTSLMRAYKTGDRGRTDAEGCIEYLGRLDGRARIHGAWVELADIEAALCALPGAKDAATRVIDEGGGTPRLVAYYVVDGARGPTVSQLRQHLARRLPTHVLPTRFVRLDRLPLNANGKIDRLALPIPDTARPNLATQMVEPMTLVQLRLAELWQELLEVGLIGIRDDFFDLGGDSLMAESMLCRVEEIFGRNLPATGLLGNATIERLEAIITSGTESVAPVVAIREEGDRPPFFFLHGDYLSGGFYCRELVRNLNSPQPFFALHPLGVDGKPTPSSYQAMAEEHLRAIRQIQPRGPYKLGGECNGGLIAYEVARLLEAAGEGIDLLVLLSASAANLKSKRIETLATAKQMVSLVRPQLASLIRKSAVIGSKLIEPALLRGGSTNAVIEMFANPQQRSRVRFRDIYQRLDRSYVPGAFSGRVSLIWGEDEPGNVAEESAAWRSVAPNIEVFTVPGDNRTKLTRHVSPLAELLDRLLDRTSD